MLHVFTRRTSDLKWAWAFSSIVFAQMSVIQMVPHRVARYESYAADRALVQLHADVSLVFWLTPHVDRVSWWMLLILTWNYTNKFFLNRVMVAFAYWLPLVGIYLHFLFTFSRLISFFFICEGTPTTPVREPCWSNRPGFRASAFRLRRSGLWSFGSSGTLAHLHVHHTVRSVKRTCTTAFSEESGLTRDKR